jgi:hypothetical protein
LTQAGRFAETMAAARYVTAIAKLMSDEDWALP